MDEYAGIARGYDLVTERFLSRPRRAMVEECHRLGATRVLDIGCGTGVFDHMLSESLKDSADKNPVVVGIDTSASMLRIAQKKQHVTSRSSPAIVSMQADALTPPFAGNSFDIAVLALVLHESPAGADILLRKALEMAPAALILEWRMPERNLDFLGSFWVPLVERMAGKGHFQRYREFMREGGLHGLANRTGCRVVRERPLAAGSLVLALVEKG